MSRYMAVDNGCGMWKVGESLLDDSVVILATVEQPHDRAPGVTAAEARRALAYRIAAALNWVNEMSPST